MLANQPKPFTPKVVLAVAAHPDDLEFLAGGTIAKLASEGVDIHYLIVTDGSKGSDDADAQPGQVTRVRCAEQRRAAETCGVKSVEFLDYEDGRLHVTPELCCDIVRHIRRIKPDTVITLDPTVVYVASEGVINHPDHRACGQATLDAVFPLARDYLSFPELCDDEQLLPHKVQTVLLCNLERHNYAVDISSTVTAKLQSLAAHTSQFNNMDEVADLLRSRAQRDGKLYGYEYAELFMRINITDS